MVPTVAFIFMLIGFALAMFGSTTDDVERPAPRKRRRRRSTQRASAIPEATQAPLTVVPKTVRLVILESRFAGATAAEREQNKKYAHRAMRDSLHRGESPLASHLLWPGILDDDNPAERMLGIEAGLAWGRVRATVVYTDFGISTGMAKGIDRAHREGRPVEFRSIKV